MNSNNNKIFKIRKNNKYFNKMLHHKINNNYKIFKIRTLKIFYSSRCF